ncbi:hypothetical protein CLV56_3975 [Mumia flava]|uniref:Uncharacterized protein n=1 Tax=Mumia flava TaxID=1348852 RepID=A0A0B2BFA9_9ACTN|nr:hypothetical protein [Mumia flava]PJJ48271.1 hypothetical protein CLV56_3975 [Mumia flava]
MLPPPTRRWPTRGFAALAVGLVALTCWCGVRGSWRGCAYAGLFAALAALWAVGSDRWYHRAWPRPAERIAALLVAAILLLLAADLLD